MSDNIRYVANLSELNKKYKWEEFLCCKWRVKGQLEYTDSARPEYNKSIVARIYLENIITGKSKIVAAADVCYFLDDEVVMNKVINDFFYDYKKSIVYITKALKTAEELEDE